MDRARKTEAEQEEFYNTALAAALAAEAAAGREVVALTAAGIRIDLVFAGPRLKTDLLPGMQHLVTGSARPADVILHAWDGRSTGVRMPPPPCSRNDFTSRGDLWGFTSPRYRTAFHWVEYSVNCFDVETGIGVYWVQNADDLPFWAKASPVRTLLHWALERSGAQLLHAAAVGTDDGAMLITGKGGVGKSSAALEALVRGLRYLGDDYVAVRLDPEPAVYSLYSTAKLNAGDVVHVPSLASFVRNLSSAEGEKAVLYLHPEFQRQIVPCLPLKALATPRVVPQERTLIRPVDRMTLRRAGAFTTLSQLPYAGQRTQAFIDAMIDRVPGFELMLGSDREQVAAVIRETVTTPDSELRALAGHDRSIREASATPPLVSVIIPVYNGARFLGDAVRSVLAQGYPSLEIIVVDDGSTDDLQQVVSRLAVDVRFLQQDNTGPAAARNRGIRDASGAFLAFLDVDDLWPEDTLISLAAALQADAGLMVVHGHAQMLILDEESGEFHPEGNPAESFPYFIGAGLYRREAFETVGLFDVSLRFAEDTDWYTRLKESGLRVERLAQVTLQVRRHGDSMTAQKTPEELRATTLGAFRKALQRARQAGTPQRQETPPA